MAMSIISAIGGLSPVVQSLVIVGLFTLLVLVAYNRKAARNLISFLRDLRSLTQGRVSRPSLPGNHRRRNRASSTDEFDVSPQGASVGEQPLRA